MENKLTIDITKEQKHPRITSLVNLGREQGFVLYADIMRLVPSAEQEPELLEKIFTSLLSAGITFTESRDEPEENTNHTRAKHSGQNNVEYLDPDDLVSMYFNEAALCPLLTADEEVALAKSIERGQAARDKLTRSPDLPEQQRTNLQTQINEGWKAVDHLIKANSRLVISVAKKYTGRGVPFLDLIQEGNIGLMRATKKFDYRRGYKFSTYATWWIRQAVSRAVADQGRTIRMPVHMSDQVSKMFRIQHKLKQRLGREPDNKELAQALGCDIEKVENMLQVARHPLSLETPTSFEDDAVLGDFIEDKESPAPYQKAETNLLQQDLKKILQTLPAREVKILQLRYGLTDGKRHTLQEVGNKMGVSRERVRQIESQALRRLRQPNIKHKLREYLGPRIPSPGKGTN